MVYVRVGEGGRSVDRRRDRVEDLIPAAPALCSPECTALVSKRLGCFMVAYTTTCLPWWRPSLRSRGLDRRRSSPAFLPGAIETPGPGWLPRAAQVDVLYRGAVVSHLGYGAHRARLVRQHGAVADGPMHGAAQLPLQVEWRMCLPLQQLLFKVWYVVSGDPVDQVVGTPSFAASQSLSLTCPVASPLIS